MNCLYFQQRQPQTLSQQPPKGLYGNQDEEDDEDGSSTEDDDDDDDDEGSNAAIEG